LPLPRWLRRLTLAPLALVLTIGALITLPLWALAAAVASRFVPGRWRPIRLLWFAIVYAALEAVVLICAFGLWIASGFGRNLNSERFVDRHYRLLGWALDRLVRTARRTFNVNVELPRVPVNDAPRIVLARHAGPGDSFLLVHAVLSTRGRRPRIVLKDTFQWEPMIDTLLGRLPCRFVSPNPRPGKAEGTIAVVAELANDMGPRDALIIFPEGGNITERRRLHSIAKLEERGHHAEAQRARLMRHVMAPRPGGALAALDACPRAEVVFVAHTGLEQLSSVVDLWRGLPMDAAVRAQAWVVPREEIPDDQQERVQWLFGWWKRIDTWIADTQAESWGLY
jgi:1-acyl-sn-glycerol-3-phosphate acyltransferase